MTTREIRKNPFTKEWIIFSEIRQERPDREKAYCPLCVGSEEVPVFTCPLRLSNKYPSLFKENGLKHHKLGDFYEKINGYGYCELVVYTDKHNAKFSEMSSETLLKIFETWMNATKQLSSDKSIKYILPFENYGEDVGATLLHPHGQIYAFPFLPNRIKQEVDSILEYKEMKKQCMVCDYIVSEKEKDERIVYKDESIVALVPYFASHAYDIYIYPIRHISFLHQCTRSEMKSLINILQNSIKALNSIFEKDVSYSLSLHQGPVNEEGTTAFHLYFKVHTPQRNKVSKKLLGAVETSGATYINGTLPETAAARLRTQIM